MGCNERKRRVPLKTGSVSFFSFKFRLNANQPYLIRYSCMHRMNLMFPHLFQCACMHAAYVIAFSSPLLLTKAANASHWIFDDRFFAKSLVHCILTCRLSCTHSSSSLVILIKVYFMLFSWILVGKIQCATAEYSEYAYLTSTWRFISTHFYSFSFSFSIRPPIEHRKKVLPWQHLCLLWYLEWTPHTQTCMVIERVYCQGSGKWKWM